MGSNKSFNADESTFSKQDHITIKDKLLALERRY